MKKVFATTFMVLATIITLSAASYKVDDQAIDALFNNATETSITSLDIFTDNNALDNSLYSVSSGSDVQTTVVIAWVVDWFVGGFGIHRYVLGTKDSMWAIYTFTVCGIFGIVPTVDWFVLLIDGLILGNGDKYIDNEKFFMWAN